MGLSLATQLIVLRRWTPKKLPGLQAWFDSADPTTLFTDSALTTLATADADPVGGWKDKSGNARHATQAGAARPALKLAIQNGKPAVRFDGVDDVMQLASHITPGTPGTGFAVVRKNAVGAGYKNILTIADWMLFASMTADLWGVFAGAEISSVNNLNSFAAIGYVRTDANNHLLSHNGVETSVAGAFGAAGKASSHLGANGGVAQFGNIDLCELAITSTAIPAHHRANLVRYLNKKWRVF